MLVSYLFYFILDKVKTTVFKITAPATTAGKNGIVLGEAEADSYKTPSNQGIISNCYNEDNFILHVSSNKYNYCIEKITGLL